MRSKPDIDQPLPTNLNFGVRALIRATPGRYLAVFVPVEAASIATHDVIASVADIEAAVDLLLANAGG